MHYICVCRSAPVYLGVHGVSGASYSSDASFYFVSYSNDTLVCLEGHIHRQGAYSIPAYPKEHTLPLNVQLQSFLLPFISHNWGTYISPSVLESSIFHTPISPTFHFMHHSPLPVAQNRGQSLIFMVIKPSNIVHFHSLTTAWVILHSMAYFILGYTSLIPWEAFHPLSVPWGYCWGFVNYSDRICWHLIRSQKQCKIP